MTSTDRTIRHPEWCSQTCRPGGAFGRDLVHDGTEPPTRMDRHPDHSWWWSLHRYDEVTPGGQITVERGFTLNTDHRYGVELSLEDAREHLTTMLAAVDAELAKGPHAA